MEKNPFLHPRRPLITAFLRRLWHGFRRALRVVSRPVRRGGRELSGVVIQPYRGYGTSERVYLMGRVFRQTGLGAGLPRGTVLRELADVLRRLTRWGLSEVTVRARFAGTEKAVTTDRDGYFHLDLRPEEEPAGEGPWHTVHLEVTRNGTAAETEGQVYISPSSARRVVISDIDDTVMVTGVARKTVMLWRLFVQGAESRVAFPGAAALDRGLHHGSGSEEGGEGNPMLYVSRAPWSIYEVLQAFFRLKEIPEGPILFLREWGLTLQSPLPRRAEDHKKDLIEGMLERYTDLPFILIGDSGQHDPEVYAEIVHNHPGRVVAVYIRDVTREEGRAREIEALARETEKADCPLILAEDSRTMARHALEAGFLTERAARAVGEEREDARAEAEED